jgi:drug/metabolite transporter (DMT)-like permease
MEEESRVESHPETVQKGSSGGLPKLGFLLLGAIALFWGISWPVMKTGVLEMGPWTFRSFCLVFGGLGVFLVAKVNRSWEPIPKGQLRPLLVVAFFNVTVWHVCSAYGLAYMNAGRASIVGFTMPVWASLLAVVILKERLRLSRLIGLGLGVLGLAILIGPDLHAFGSAPLGMAFMVAASISWAAGVVFMKYFRWTISTFNLTGWQLVLGSIPVVLGSLLLEPISNIFRIPWQAVLATAYMVVIPVVLCNWAWFKVVQLFPTSIAAIGTLAVPVVGVLSSAVALGEPIGLQEIAALVLLTAALSIVMLKPEGFSRKKESGGDPK